MPIISREIASKETLEANRGLTITLSPKLRRLTRDNEHNDILDDSENTKKNLTLDENTDDHQDRQNNKKDIR